MYIYEHPDWPHFTWDLERIFLPLTEAVHLHGVLAGRMEALTLESRQEANLLITAHTVVSSSAIEGEVLDLTTVKASVGRQLSSAPFAPEHPVDGAVAAYLDASQRHADPLTLDRLHSWHRALFPTGQSGGRNIATGTFRDDSKGRMQVVSYSPGFAPIVLYQAPHAAALSGEMDRFLSYLNGSDMTHPFIKAAIAHLWFVAIHPYEDGNGRIGRAIIDYILARGEENELRFYSVSSQILRERHDYYTLLACTQKGSLDITDWIIWFLHCLARSMTNAKEIVASVLRRERFYRQAATLPLSKNQLTVLARYLDDFIGNLTSSKYAKICKVSQDTATRDLKDLCNKGLFTQVGAGRSTHYVLKEE